MPMVAKTVPAPATIVESPSTMQSGKYVPGTTAAQPARVAIWWVRWYRCSWPVSTRSTRLSSSMFMSAGPESQAYSPIERQGLCMPTMTHGMLLAAAPSIACAVQARRGVPAA